MSSWGLNRDQKFYLWQCLKKLPLSVLVSLVISAIAVFYASIAHGLVVFMLLMAGAVLRIAYETMDFKQLYYSSNQTRLNVGRLATVILFFAMFGCVVDTILYAYFDSQDDGWEKHIMTITMSFIGLVFYVGYIVIGFLSDKLGFNNKEPF